MTEPRPIYMVPDNDDDRRVLSVAMDAKPHHLAFATGIPNTRGDTIANAVFLDREQVNALINVLTDWFDEDPDPDNVMDDE